MKERNYGWTVEIQARAVEEKLRIAEIRSTIETVPPVKTKSPETRKSSLMAG